MCIMLCQVGREIAECLEKATTKKGLKMRVAALVRKPFSSLLKCFMLMSTALHLCFMMVITNSECLNLVKILYRVCPGYYLWCTYLLAN